MYMQPRNMRALAAAAPAKKTLRFILRRFRAAVSEHAIIQESATGKDFSKASSCYVSVASILPEKKSIQKSAVVSPVKASRPGRSVITKGLSLYSMFNLPILPSGLNNMMSECKDIREVSSRQHGVCVHAVSYTHLRAHETRHDLVC